MSAVDMVGRLRERYALTMEQVDLREAPCIQLEVHAGGQCRRPVERACKRVGILRYDAFQTGVIGRAEVGLELAERALQSAVEI